MSCVIHLLSYCLIFIHIYIHIIYIGHGDTSSNPGLIGFYIALIPLGKGMNPIISRAD